jgi:hypothetical protein
VNTDTDRSSERVWEYLHGELDEAGRSALERAMAGDSELRRGVERAGRLDRLLRELLPELAPDAAGGGVAEQAQAAWEQEQARAAELPRVKRAWWRKARSAAVCLASLAAAAVLVLVFSPAAGQAPDVRWAEPEFSSLVLRGGGEPPQGHAIDAAVARRCQAALRSAVEACATERAVSLPRGLTFSFRVQALRDGAFSVAVQARTRGGRLDGEWFGDYSGAGAFLKQVKASAARMVEAVAERTGEDAERGRP